MSEHGIDWHLSPAGRFARDVAYVKARRPSPCVIEDEEGHKETIASVEDDGDIAVKECALTEAQARALAAWLTDTCQVLVPTPGGA